MPLFEWFQSDPKELKQRLALLLYLQMSFAIPLLLFAIYLWSLGSRIVRAREFPPPGIPVVRDTPIKSGSAAVRRGRLYQVLAVSLATASVLWCLVIWRLTEQLNAHLA